MGRGENLSRDHRDGSAEKTRRSGCQRLGESFLFQTRVRTDSLSCVEGKHTAGTAKFELFATLTMKDATTKTYTAIYDCRNPDWQLVSLPIVDDLKDVEKIQVGIDYTDNNDKSISIISAFHPQRGAIKF